MKLDCQEENKDKTQTITEELLHKKIERDLDQSVDCKYFLLVSY